MSSFALTKGLSLYNKLIDFDILLVRSSMCVLNDSRESIITPRYLFSTLNFFNGFIVDKNSDRIFWFMA